MALALALRASHGLILYACAGSGKSALVNAWLDGAFTVAYSPTCIDLHHRELAIQGSVYTVCVTDLGGDVDVLTGLRHSLAGCDAIVLVCAARPVVALSHWSICAGVRGPGRRGGGLILQNLMPTGMRWTRRRVCRSYKRRSCLC